MRRIAASLALVVLLGGGVYLAFVVLPDARAATLSFGDRATSTEAAAKPAAPAVVHLPTPSEVKALYMTACYAADSTLRSKLIKIADDTEVNAMVVDIKDWSGTISFTPDDPALAAEATSTGAPFPGCVVRDMRALVKELHDHNIYAIARLTVFQDPRYAKLHPEQAVQNVSGGVWRDAKGIAFIDVDATPYWGFVKDLSMAAYGLGFDEINYDYVRFPTDGDMSAARYPYSQELSGQPGGKRTALNKFFAYLAANIPEGAPVTSADFFGMTTSAQDDMGIGQYLEDGLRTFDYLAPMVYPSHYPATWNGYKNPNSDPGGVVYDAMKFAVDRANALASATGTPAALATKIGGGKSLRTWIQDFDYGGDYDATDVRAEIDSGIRAGAIGGFMVWDPANHYTPAALRAS